MKKARANRRDFMKSLAGSAALISALPNDAAGDHRSAAIVTRKAPPAIRFAVIGVNHAHINSQVGAVLRGGGELVSVHAKEPDLAEAFVKRFPQAKRARSEEEILEDGAVQLVLSS